MQDLEYTQNDCGRYINLNDGKLKMEVKKFSRGALSEEEGVVY